MRRAGRYSVKDFTKGLLTIPTGISKGLSQQTAPLPSSPRLKQRRQSLDDDNDPMWTPSKREEREALGARTMTTQRLQEQYNRDRETSDETLVRTFTERIGKPHVHMGKLPRNEQ